MIYIVFGNLGMNLAKERRHYICDIFSHWLRPFVYGLIRTGYKETRLKTLEQ